MRKLTMPSLVSTFILLLAMSGAAMGAKYLITSPNQIKPSVLKKLKGPKGATGAAGAAGSQGPAGPAGPAGGAGEKGATGDTGATGEDGTDGTNGTNGTSVTVEPIAPLVVACNELGGAKVKEAKTGGASVDVCNGKEGKDGEPGKEGSPWTLGGTLPVGATLTGHWSALATAAGPVVEPISFPIKLAAAAPNALDSEHVHYQTDADFKTFNGEGGCKTNNPNNPTAPSGHLCVYKGPVEDPAGALTNVGIFEAALTSEGASKAGAFLKFEASEPGFINGTWALTG